ncbi:NifU family protein [Mycobacterium sp. CVI_P3]|uniref:NifU family protein n=1 Tax=Mycobacterium pinniadriaticum TaxID=2994102 RepID=A0ABT3SBN8_9MYCO|nr:NifU family protein [Mycobacterium pinniadriaticum]MCX2929813.1 NifU family protein [Mycobacterium pinniadriaticum]MCX2936538.1 NifU family protein [Mycobacterium pinniadriaticum]
MDADSHWRSAGERIQSLLDASAVGGPVAAARAEQLVREVVDLYGAALTRAVDLLDDAARNRLVTDDLVASLLLVHGLHPHDVTRRVSHALETVRPYLGSHGGDVRLVEIRNRVVRLAFSGSCKSCPSSAVTLELAVQDAVRAAAPEITAIEIVPADQPADATVIPAESLMSRVQDAPHHRPTWHPVPELAELVPGEVAGFTIDGTTILACRSGEEIFAYRDHCPSCAESLSGATLSGSTLRCQRCHARYDVVHAGTGIAGTGEHLEPVPVLTRDGVLSLALADETIGAPA